MQNFGSIDDVFLIEIQEREEKQRVKDKIEEYVHKIGMHSESSSSREFRHSHSDTFVDRVYIKIEADEAIYV